MEQGEPRQKAKAPFDGEDGWDVTIQTSDGVDFYLHKAILSLASPIFKDMFTFEQPPHREDLNQPVPIDENATTFDAVMRFCYPTRAPVIEDVAHFDPVLRAVDKYRMDEIAERVREAFRKAIKDHPLYAYALSCRFDLEDEAIESARLWKTSVGAQWKYNGTSPSWTIAERSFSPEIGTVSGGAYRRLLSYLVGRTVLRFCSPDNKAGLSACDHNKITTVYPFTIPDTDFAIRSYDGAEFRVHRLLVTLHVDPAAANASRSLLQVSDTTSDGVPLVVAQIDCCTLASLLTLCYPPSQDGPFAISDWSSQTYCGSLKVIRAAQDHGMSPIVRAYRSQFNRHLEESAVEMYCVAASLGWTAEMRWAAEKLANDGDEVIWNIDTPMLEHIQATEYHRLLRFCHDYRQIVIKNMGIEPYQGWQDVSQWREEWYTNIVGRRTRMVPSILVEKEVLDAQYSRSHYQGGGGKFDLKEMVRLSQKMEAVIKREVDQIEL